jgi:hypothetical protein
MLVNTVHHCADLHVLRDLHLQNGVQLSRL